MLFWPKHNNCNQLAFKDSPNLHLSKNANFSVVRKIHVGVAMVGGVSESEGLTQDMIIVKDSVIQESQFFFFFLFLMHRVELIHIYFDPPQL